MRRYVGVAGTRHQTDLYQVSVFEGDKRIRGLAPRTDLVNHSPTGFCWGYGGSGPSQLALAILVDHFGLGAAGEKRALRLYHDFKWACVSKLPQGDDFELREDQVDEFVRAIEPQTREDDDDEIRTGEPR